MSMSSTVPATALPRRRREGTDRIESSVTYTIAALANVENLTLTGTGNINGTGNAGDNVITGNDGNNKLSGGVGATLSAPTTR